MIPNTQKKEMLQRVLSVLEEMDELKETLKDLYVEVRNREDDLGFSAKELREAVALLRKGPKKTVNQLNERLQFLRDCQIQDAIDAAFQ